jgi:hypothetical protein
MKWIKETDTVADFPFWDGASDVADQINSRLDADKIWNFIDSYFDNLNHIPAGYEVNNYLWFYAEDDIKEHLGIDIWDDDDEDYDE